MLVTALSLVGVTRLKQEEDLLVFLPTSDPDVQLFKEVSRRFGALRVALIGVETPPGEDVFSPAAVSRIAAATDAIRNVHGVDRVASMASLPDVIVGPLGAEVTPLLPGPPKNEAEHRALREKVLSREAISGSFVSKDAHAALIMAFLAEGVGDRVVTEELRTVAEGALRPYALFYGGAPFAARTIYEEAQADVWKLSPLALAILLLVVVVSFRDPVGVVLTVASVAFAVLVVLGGMGWWGEKFTVASSTLPVILFASGSSYAVHVLGRYYLVRKDDAPRPALERALRIVGPPLAIAAATTAVGFFSFIATDVRPMRAFGIACGSGVLLCWVTSLTLVPAVMTLWPRPARPARELALVGGLLVALWHWAKRHRALVGGASFLLAAALVQPMLRVTVRMEPRAFFRAGSEPWLAERFLEEKFGGAHFVQVAVRGDLDDPATQRELARLVDYTRSLDGVTQVQSILDPLRIVNDVMGGGKRLPTTAAQAANLYFFIEGEPGAQALIAPGREEALLHVRVRGEATPVVGALEEFVARRLKARPGEQVADEVAERVGWVLRALGHRAVDGAALRRAMRVLAPPGEADPEWSSRRLELARAFLSSDDAPALTPNGKATVLAAMSLAGTASSAARSALLHSAPSVEEGALAWAALTARLDEERRSLAVGRALPVLLSSAGLDPSDAALRAQLAPIVDDRFAPPVTRPPRLPLSAKVAGEPILDRGFSRSVERNQIRSLLVAIAAVLLLLLLLFRSLRLAVVCMAPSLLTMIVLFGAMGLAGVHIDLGTSLVAGIATGAGSDFAMHYVWYLRNEPADQVSRTVGPVMVVSILLVSLGFVVLALGKSPVMRLFGNLAGLAMALSALLTCLLVPALVNKVGGDRPTP